VNSKPILIIPGEKKSIFFEIFFKSIKSSNFVCPLIIIFDKKKITHECRKYNFQKEIETIKINDIYKKKLLKRKIYLIDVKYQNSSNHVQKCFGIAFKLIKNGLTHKLINGPINKTKTLNRKYLGITEYIADNFKQKDFAMLIYNKKLSVCPITTHLPLSLVSKNITKKIIVKKVNIVNNFYKKSLGYKPKIAIVGLNPHCESILKFNEDDKIVKKTVNILKKKINIKGPFSSDTIFLKNNRRNFNVIMGMYHDQVLGPMKTLFEYDAINITLGLPFLRVSPDHGPNEKMVGKNKSNPISLIKAIKFLDKK
tara:strand:+ start:272 stop:1204 length:933 start_codon:yes stop_codon:yes gene_type:complete